MRAADSCAGNLHGRSTDPGERNTPRESPGDHPLVFLSSWLGAAALRNADTLFVCGMPQGRGQYDEEVEKG